MHNLIYNDFSKMVFVTNKENNLEPIMYDCYIEDEKVKGTRIEKNSIYYMFIKYIRYSSSSIDKQSGLEIQGYLEVYQWAIAFNIIKNAIELKSNDLVIAISRQSGKSKISRTVCAFLLIFAPLYVKIPENRYCIAWCSPSRRLSADHLAKLKPDIEKAVELFNIEFQENKIITKSDDKTIRENNEIMEFNRMINGQIIEYSSLVILSLNKAVVNAGFSIHLILVDESQEISASSFLMQVAPTTTRTSGIIVALGTTNSDPSNLLFDLYNSSEIPDDRKIIYTWEDVYDMKKLRNEDDADKYRVRVLKEIAKYGVSSEYIQTQFHCSFKTIGDRFTTIEKLNSYELFKGNAYGIENYDLSKFDYIIASFDSARFHDYAGLLLGGINRKIDNLTGMEYFEYNVFEFRIFNEDKKQLSPDDLSNMVSEVCQIYKIDMLIYDTTAQQIDRAYYLQKEFDKRKIKTFIIPLNYSNKKMFMFQTLEDAMMQKQISLPAIDFRENQKAYDEFIDEILYLKKIKKDNGKFDYKAPDGENFKDDLAMVFAQFIYCPIYIKRCREKDNLVTQNISAEYNKIINFYKLGEHEETEERAKYYRR